MTPSAVSTIDAAFRTEWPRLVATLTRELHDLQLAEDSAQDAFVEAARHWRRSGTPDRPGAWLLTTARRKAIDRIRRAKRFDDRLPAIADELERLPGPRQLIDDQLALLFGCCHPALTGDAQVALTLRSVAGLTTAQIAHAFLVPEATMAKRLVRAKNKIRTAGIPFSVPEAERLQERLAAVCGVVYAIFTEGHASAHGTTLLRGDLCDEAIWLAETLAELAPDEAEVRSLAALCLLTDARRATRIDDDGLPVLLADQDRTRWDSEKTRRGIAHLLAANALGGVGTYQLQATIAAIHSTAARWEETDWPAIIGVYDVLLSGGGGPVVALNRAVAIGEHEGPAAALALLDELDRSRQLERYHYFHSARAEMLQRLDRPEESAAAFERALRVCDNEEAEAWIRRRLAEVVT